MDRSERQGEEPKGWYSRGYLPHIDAPGLIQSVTFRLYDSFPEALVGEWKHELSHLTEVEQQKEQIRRINRYLDCGHGQCWLRRPDIARMVESAFLFFHNERYELRAWVVMPNHVHLLLVPICGYSLPGILNSLKGYTAHQANTILGRCDHFWNRESFDRYVRDAEHYGNTIRYIEGNPVKANLCERAEDFAYSSARYRRWDGEKSHLELPTKG